MEVYYYEHFFKSNKIKQNRSISISIFLLAIILISLKVSNKIYASESINHYLNAYSYNSKQDESWTYRQNIKNDIDTWIKELYDNNDKFFLVESISTTTDNNYMYEKTNQLFHSSKIYKQIILEQSQNVNEIINFHNIYFTDMPKNSKIIDKYSIFIDKSSTFNIKYDISLNEGMSCMKIISESNDIILETNLSDNHSLDNNINLEKGLYNIIIEHKANNNGKVIGNKSFTLTES